MFDKDKFPVYLEMVLIQNGRRTVLNSTHINDACIAITDKVLEAVLKLSNIPAELLKENKDGT